MKYNKSESPFVKLSFIKDGDTNLLCIEDNGIGIEKEHFDKIFEMFQRIQVDSSSVATGIGLATCKKIVDGFGGVIIVESEVGKGTIFKIELPESLIVLSDRSPKHITMTSKLPDLSFKRKPTAS